jgi:uncharacterized Ntn-hydrolase superfamily protein
VTDALATPLRLAATYSIVARDVATGEIGVAVQSHYFAVGTSVAWAEPGVGAVATQAFFNPAFGPVGLRLLREGCGPEAVIDRLLADDAGRELRQLALVDAHGKVAVHTGKLCVACAGHRVGDGFSVQGNMLRSEGVWDAMAAAYAAGRGELPERLVAALAATERAGGDVRGRQSAALLVVSGRRSERPWEERRIDLRVDDHRDPVTELARLLVIQRATEAFDAGMQAFQGGDPAGALERLAQARALHPDEPQFHFWAGVVALNAGRPGEAIAPLRRAGAADSGWLQLLLRLVPSGLVPDDPALIAKLADSRGC